MVSALVGDVVFIPILLLVASTWRVLVSTVNPDDVIVPFTVNAVDGGYEVPPMR